MSDTRKLVIHKLYFTESDCYNSAPIQKQIGVQVHCTVSGNPYLKRYVQPNDGLIGKNKYGNSHNRPGVNVCANAYIGKLDNGEVAVYQTLPFEKRCWLSGSASKGNANRVGYIGFEVCCLLSDEEYFRSAVMDEAVKLTAYLCHTYDFDPFDITECGYAVMDHSELHKSGYASNHADVTNWLKKYGLTMNDFRNEVAKALKEGVEVEIIETATGNTRRTLKKGTNGPDVVELQKMLVDIGFNLEIDGCFGMATKEAVMLFQQSAGLTADGIVGPLTWKELDGSKRETEDKEDRNADKETHDLINDIATHLGKVEKELAFLREKVDELKSTMGVV